MQAQSSVTLTAMGSTGTGSGPWVIAPEERTKHETTFRGLNPSNGFITGKRAKEFFMSCKLPPMVLGHIWNLADMDRDGKMTMQEFSIAMHLIQCKLKGVQLPMTLPNSLKMSSMPSTFAVSQSGSSKSAGNFGSSFGQTSVAPVANGFSSMSMSRTGSSGISWSGIGQSASSPAISTGFGSQFGNLGTGANNSFTMGMQAGFSTIPENTGNFNDSGITMNTPAGQTGFGGSVQRSQSLNMSFSQSQQNFNTITGPARLKYNQMFKSFDHQQKGFLAGEHARSILIQSGLPQQTLAQIWNLSDVDKDGQLNIEEFALAMHLVEMAKSGKPLPQTVPQELMPPSFQGRALSDSVTSVGGTEGRERSGSTRSRSGSSSDPIFTFEDKRKQNFEKGRLELERRRQDLRDKMTKEREEREKKEREEEERKQRAKLEAEQKRQAELDKQRQQQLEMEREQEALRKKMIQQRLQAQLEAERQRQLEWEKRKKEELLNQKGLEQDIVNNLKARVTKLSEELDTVSGNRSDVQQTVDLQRQALLQCQSALSLVNQSREMRFAEISRVQCDIKEHQQRLEVLVRERERLSLERDKRENNSISEAHGNAMASLQDTRGNIMRLQLAQQSMEGDLAGKLKNLDLLNNQLKDLRNSIQQVTNENARLQQIAETKQREYNAWKLKKDREEREKRDSEARRRREEEERKEEARRQKEREMEAMRQEQERQRKEQEMRKRLQEARQAEERRQAELQQQLEQEKQRQQQLQREQELRERQLQEQKQREQQQRLQQQQQDYKKDQLLSKDKSIVQQQMSLQAKPVFKQEESVQTSGAGVRSKIQQMQRLISDQQSDVKPKEPTSVSQKPAVKHIQYQGLYEFEPRNPDELGINEGDIIKVNPGHKGAPPGWLFGECNGKSGLFPGNYAEKMEEQPVAVERAEPVESTPASAVAAGPNVSQLRQALGLQLGLSGGTAAEPVSVTQSHAVTSEGSQAGGGTPVHGGLRAVALYAYRGIKEGHLSFNKNDMITVHEQQDMWWSGELNGKIGWFPKSYIKLVIGADKTAEPSTKPDEVQTASVTAAAPDQKPATLFECVAMYPYTGEAGDLSFAEGDIISVTKADGEWWEGQCKGDAGLFPANYVKKKETEPPKAAPRTKPEIATVTAAYTATSPDQLSLAPGQLILVKKKNPDGWWEGELQARGKKRQSGVFPGNHVKIMSKTDKKAITPTTTPSDTPATSGRTTPQLVEETIYDTPSLLVQSAQGKLEQVLAMFPYSGQRADELTFFKGSVINVMSKEGDWWRGELNGKVGVFPSNYVQPLTNIPISTTQWTGSFDAKLLASMSDTERKRQNCIYELINTEQTFMDDLSMTMEVFYNPMAESGMMNEHELQTVFVNMNELIVSNMKLLKAFLVRKKMCNNGKIMMIGDILCEQLPRLSPYVRYCSCMTRACSLIQEKIENIPEFKQFEKKCASNQRSSGLPMSSYLLKPLQRVCKYPLLIKEIMKYTPVNHPDRINIENALEKAEELCLQVNEGVRYQENSDRLEWLQAHVITQGLSESLIFNSTTNCLGPRKILYEGTLYKAKSGKELKAFLFNDFLLLTRPQTSIAGNFTKKMDSVKYTVYRQPIVLNEVVVKSQEQNSEETVFHISHIDRIYSFRAESKNIRAKWMTHLEKASEHYIETERLTRQKAHRERARSFRTGGLGKLNVTIIEGAQLKASDPNGFSDPYCEVSMGSQEHRTKVIPQTLNPKWNSAMSFLVKDLQQDVLCITVFDRDFFSPNDFLGRTEVSLAKLLEKGKGPWTERLLLYEVPTGEVLLRLELQLNEK